MFTRIGVRNFKGIKQVDISLSRINLFMGENGTGKSTLLQGVSLLKRSSGSGQIRTDLPYANIGALVELVHPSEPSEIQLEGTTAPTAKSKAEDKARFEVRLNFDENGYRAQKEVISYPQIGTITQKWYRGGPPTIEPTQLSLGNATFTLGATNVIGIAFQVGAARMEAGDLSPDVAQAQVEHNNAFLRALSESIIRALNRFEVVPPMRGLTDPLQSQPAARSGEYEPRRTPIASSLVGNLVYSRKSEQIISDWLKEVVGVGLSIEVMEGPVVRLRNPDKDTSFVNEGFGSNQLLFILEKLANAENDATVAIEEPEIHLHPKAQFILGKLLATIAVKRGVQLLITTHSPDLLSGVLAAVRQKKTQAEDVSVWFFEHVEGKTQVSDSKVKPDGTIVGKALASFVETSIDQVSDFFPTH